MSTIIEPISALPDAELDMRPLLEHELAELATPAYVYDPAVAISRWEVLRSALGTRLVVSYKANSLVDLMVRCGHRFRDGVELASIGELGVVTGRIAQRRFVNNPAMDEAFLRAAALSGCDVIVDSVAQASRLAAMAKSERPTRAHLRLNAAAIGSGGAAADHFGMDLEDATLAARVLRDSPVDVTGIHSFAGSQTFSRQGMQHARCIAAALELLQHRLGFDLSEVNLGGGFEADWERRFEDLQAYRALLDNLFGSQFDLAHESGRGIFAAAGAFVTRVVAVKRLGDRHVAVCDGGMAQNFLLAVTEGMLRKHACPHVVPAQGDGQRQTPSEVPVQFVGSSCSRQDVIGYDAQANRVPEVGDYCVFDRCGAYNGTYTVSGFLMLPTAQSYIRAMR